ncbi:MAG: CPBP family glutamic-type intramembrane protease [Burkholderiales bacterium]
MNVRDEVAALGRFLRAPRRRPGPRLNARPWLPRLLVLAVSTIAVAILVDAATTPLATWAGLESKFPDKVTPRLLFLALVFAPIGEELLFRAGLRRADYTLAIGPALLTLAIAPWVRTTFVVLAAWAIAALAINRLLARHTLRRPGARFALGRRFIAHYAWIFWGYTVAFALMHIGNYSGSGPRGTVVPLLVLPQFVIGTVLGYLRLRDGLRSSMLMHFLVNCSAMALLGVSP